MKYLGFAVVGLILGLFAGAFVGGILADYNVEKNGMIVGSLEYSGIVNTCTNLGAIAGIVLGLIAASNSDNKGE